MSLRLIPLTPDLWPEVERLFGPRGATAGCWRQWVMLAKGERFEDVQGEEAHARFERHGARLDLVRLRADRDDYRAQRGRRNVVGAKPLRP